MVPAVRTWISREGAWWLEGQVGSWGVRLSRLIWCWFNRYILGVKIHRTKYVGFVHFGLCRSYLNKKLR